MKSLIVLVLAVLLTGCGYMPSERAVYHKACEAVRSNPGLPADAAPVSIDEAELHVAKNAAIVELPYYYTDESGERVRGSHRVWLKRIARRWEIDRSIPTPGYSTEE